MRAKLLMLFLGISIGALFLTRHYELHLGNHNLSLVLSIMAATIAFVFSLIFFVLSFNHCTFRKQLYLNTDRLGLSMVVSLLVLQAMTYFVHVDGMESNNCLQYVGLQFASGLTLGFLFVRNVKFLHKKLLLKQIMWGLFFVASGMLFLTCGSNALEHISLSHILPLLIYSILILVI